MIYLFLAATSLSHSSLPTGETETLSAQIVRANRDYESSLVSLHVQYEIIGGVFNPPDGRSLPRKKDGRWTYARSRQREVLYSALEDYDANYGRHWSSFNGTHGATLTFAMFDPILVDRMQVAAGQRPLSLEYAVIPRALGWQCRGHGSLVSLMELASHRDITREPARVVGEDNAQQVFPSVKWVLKRFRDRPEWPEHELAAWFSEEHGWLPRAIQILPRGDFEKNKDGSTLLPQGSQPHQVAVLEYMTVQDTILQQPRYFPRKVSDFALRSEITIVKSVTANEAVPDDLFDPKLQDGAMIVSEPGTPRERRDFVGGEAGERLHHQMMAKNDEFLGRRRPLSAGPVTANLAKINAKPETLFWPMSRLIFYGSTLLLLAAGLIWFIRSKSSA